MEAPRAMVACSKSLIKSLIDALDGNAWRFQSSDDQAPGLIVIVEAGRLGWGGGGLG